jgi:hypothetical protein
MRVVELRDVSGDRQDDESEDEKLDETPTMSDER